MEHFGGDTALDNAHDFITARPNIPEIDRLTIFDAFRRDLGLRIESRTGPYEVLVIDSVEMPTPN